MFDHYNVIHEQDLAQAVVKGFAPANGKANGSEAPAGVSSDPLSSSPATTPL